MRGSGTRALAGQGFSNRSIAGWGFGILPLRWKPAVSPAIVFEPPQRGILAALDCKPEYFAVKRFFSGIFSLEFLQGSHVSGLAGRACPHEAGNGLEYTCGSRHRVTGEAG